MALKRSSQPSRQVRSARSLAIRLDEIELAGEQVIALTPEEQLAFWNALHQPVRLSEAQRQLGSIMRGEARARFDSRMVFRLETLRREHPRLSFRSGEESVDHWLATRALQCQEKNLSVTRALFDVEGEIAGYYTLATGQVDFSDLPAEVVRHLPRRTLPVAVLAWLGVSKNHQGPGLGGLLLAQQPFTSRS